MTEVKSSALYSESACYCRGAEARVRPFAHLGLRCEHLRKTALAKAAIQEDVS